MLHAPDAAEVMVAIGPSGGVVRAVCRAARVVVNCGLIVKIDHVKRAIRTDARVDGAEPEIATGDELGFLPARLLAGDVSHPVRLQPVVMHEADGWLGEKMGAVESVRPGAAVVDAGAGRGGEHADPIDLDVRRPGVVNGREYFLMIRNDGRGAQPADVAARQDFFRHHDVQEMLAARGGRVEHLAVRREVEAPRVARAGSDLLQRGAVGPEADDPGGDAAEIICAIRRPGIARAVADGAVDPPVHAPAEIVDDRMGVSGAETGVKGLDLVRHAIAVGVANPEDVGRLGYDHAVLVKHQ